MKILIWCWIFTWPYYGDSKYLKMRFDDTGSCLTQLEDTVGKNARGLVKILIKENINKLATAVGEAGARKIMDRGSARITESLLDSIVADVEVQVKESLRRLPWKIGKLDKNLGNKLNFLEPNCLQELEWEITLNASRLVEVTYKDRIEEMSKKAGEVAGRGIDMEKNILDFEQVATEVGSYLAGNVKKLQIKDNMVFISNIILEKLCKLHNCCYLP